LLRNWCSRKAKTLRSVPGWVMRAPDEQRLDDRPQADVLLQPGLLGELGGGVRHGGRAAADEPTGSRLAVQAERRLHPGGERIAVQLLVGLRRPASLDGRGEDARVAVGGQLLCRAAQRLADHPLGCDLAAEQPGRDLGHLGTLVSEAATASHRGRRADALQVGRLACVPHPAHQQGDIRALTPPIGVQLVQDQEAEPSGRLDEVPAFAWPQEHQLQHHVVGEDDVGRVAEDLLALLVTLLTRVPREGHRRAPLREAVLEELAQLAALAVGQRIHRIDHDGADASAAALSKDAVDDRHEVAQALARACAGGEHVAPSGWSDLDGLALMPVQRELRPVALLGASLDPEDPPAALMEDAGVHQLVDRATGLEARVEGEPWIRPTQATPELLVDVGADALVANLQEPSGVRLVISDQPVTNLEDVQVSPQGLAVNA